MPERRRELGLLKAIGARRRQIIGLLLIEAVSVTSVGGAAGCVLGLLLMRLFEHSLVYYLESIGIPFLWLGSGATSLFALLCILLATLIGAIGAFLPAWQASRREPYDLIRSRDRAMLACVGLAKAYVTERGEVEAVRGVDLEVSGGAYAAVVGRSGSGKSSLMAMIGGLSRPTRGRVHVEGTDIWAVSESGLAKFRNHRIGFVFQFASLLASLRIIDNVALPALLGGRVNAVAVYGAAAALLDELRLSPGTPTPIRRRSPPGNSGAPSSPARSSTNRRCCWPMSRPPIWTSRPRSS